VKETRGFIDLNLLPTIGAVPLSTLRGVRRRLRAIRTSNTAKLLRDLGVRSPRGVQLHEEPPGRTARRARSAADYDNGVLRAVIRQFSSDLAEVSLDGVGTEQRISYRRFGGLATDSSCRSSALARRAERESPAR
jgi:hypothetical protein